MKQVFKKIGVSFSVAAVAAFSLAGLQVINSEVAKAEEDIQLADVVYETQAGSHAGNGVSDSCDVTGDGVEDVLFVRNWWQRARNSGYGYANYGAKGAQAVTGAAYIVPGGHYENGHVDDEASGVIRIEGGFDVYDGMKER